MSREWVNQKIASCAQRKRDVQAALFTIKPFARVYQLALLAKDGVWTEMTGGGLPSIHTMEAYKVRKSTQTAHHSWHAIIWKHAPSGKCIVGWTATGDNDPVVKTFPDEATARAAAALSL